MKKTAFILWVALLLFPPGNFLQGKVVSLEVKGAYFQPTEKVFKEIYGNGQTYGLELGIRIWGGLAVWASGDYFTATGKLTFTGEVTKIRIIPVCGGGKYYFLSGRISPYVGLGVGYFAYKEESPIGKVEKGNLGYIGKAGISFNISSGIIIDIQADYSHCQVKPAEVKANLGGLQAGIGLGVVF